MNQVETLMRIVIILIGAYILLLWDFHATTETSNYKYEFNYNGIVWVALDCWSIAKYNSDDEPMRMISFNRTKKSNQLKIKEIKPFKTVIAPIGNWYLTKGKEYEVRELEFFTEDYGKENVGFKLVADDGRETHCLLKNDAHLNGQDWIIKDESEQSDACKHENIKTQRYKDLSYEINEGRDFYTTIYIDYCDDCGNVISVHE